MLRTLRSRLIVSHILPILIIIPLMGIALIYAMESRVLLARSTTQLLDNAALVIELSSHQPQVWQDPEMAGQLTAEVAQYLDSRVMLLDGEGKLLASSDPQDAARVGQDLGLTDVAAVLSGQTRTQTHRSRNLDAEVTDVLMPALGSDGSVIGVVRMTHRLGNIYDDLLHMRDVVSAILVVGLLLGVVLALILASNLIRPVNQFVDEMQTMTASKELVTVPEVGIQEMQKLVQTFNILVERLHAQDIQQRSLLANLVHELGRPLGALRSAIDALLGGAAEVETFRDEMLNGMADEIVLLQRLLEDLARLYDRESGSIKLVLQPVQLSTWLSQMLLSWKADAQKKGLSWHADIPIDLPTLQIDPGRMAQALGNLLSNAVKYTPAGGAVRVAASNEPGYVTIKISDTGIGIPAEEQALVFTPFYRGHWSGRFPQGLGLGLNIAHELILAHGGQLALESNHGHGTIFTVWLPA